MLRMGQMDELTEKRYENRIRENGKIRHEGNTTDKE
jgi:hypothetical protein